MTDSTLLAASFFAPFQVQIHKLRIPGMAALLDHRDFHSIYLRRLGEQESPFKDIFQFADIAGPAVFHDILIIATSLIERPCL